MSKTIYSICQNPKCSKEHSNKKYCSQSCMKSMWMTNEQLFVSNGTNARQYVKRRILRENLISYRCAICNIGPEWNDKPMPLILDHINGKSRDHRLENLRFVCSNCDCQLPTYKSKNI